MPGTVSVFNLYNEPITALSVSGYSAGNVPGYTTGTYAPGAIATPVPRSSSPLSSASFVTGDNAVSVPWNSFTGKMTIVGPDPSTTNVSIDDPLILYIAINLALLVTTRGYVLSQATVTLRNNADEVVEPESV